MIARQHAHHLRTRLLPTLQVGRNVNHVADDARVEIRIVQRQIAHHGRVRHEDLVAVHPVVARVLVLGRHQAHDAKGQAVDGKRIAGPHRAFAEEHLAHVVADHRDARRAVFVRLHQEAAPADRDAADLRVQRLHAQHGERSPVEPAGGARLVLQFGHDVPHPEALLLDVAQVVVVQPNAPARAQTAGLLLRAPGKENHDVLAQLLETVALAFFEAVAHGHDQHDRSHPPRNPGHRQETAQLVAQQRRNHLGEEFPQEKQHAAPTEE
jgi:hypothetical protein